MAVAFVQEFPIDAGGDRSTTNYDAVNERLTAGKEAPDGLILHTAGFDEEAGVFRIMNFWETQEQGQRYHDEVVMPIVNEVLSDSPPGPPSRQSFYKLHHVAGP